MRPAFVLVLTLCLAPALLAQESNRPQPSVSPPLEAPQLRFDHLTVQDGLAQGTVSGLYQDRQGFIWIANQSALQRYDGYAFQTYRFSDLDSTAIPTGQLERIIEDAAGRLYLGSSAGLYLFDPATGKARRLYPASGDTLSGFVPDFVLEGDSVAWLATAFSGIVRLDLKTGARRVYQNRPGDPESLSHNGVLYLYLDSEGILWASTLDGLNRLAPATGKITRYPEVPHGLENILADPAQPGVIWIGSTEGLIRFETRTGTHTLYIPDPGEALLNWVNWLAFDPADADVLWMTTMYGGLLRFDTATEQFTRYRRDEDDPNSLVSDQTWSLLVDRNGTLWVGTEGGGISRFDPAAGVFAHYQPVPSRTPSPEQNYVGAVFEDRDGALWMGGSGTVYRLDRLSGTRSSYRLAPDDIRHGTVINSIVQDAAGGLWVSVAGHGVFRRKTSTDGFVALPVNAADSTALCDVPMVWWEEYALLEDRTGMLWVGVNDCLHRIEPRTGRITRFRLPTPADSSVGAFTLFQDQEGRLWAGSYGLLVSLDPATGRIERTYRFELGSANTFSGADINSIYERAREPGVLWIGTAGGLDRLDTRTGTFTHFTEQEGLPDNVTKAILEDDEGRLWMSTNSGIVRFDPQTHAVQHYGRKAGLRSTEFNWGAAFRSSRGELFFGGVDGVYSFFPEQFHDNPHPPQVALTGLRLFNKPVEVGAPDSLLKRPLSETEEFRLRHDQDVVTFEFVALHYKDPEKNTYAYRLEGFDVDWVQAGSRREATYTNLDPGRYTFRVKAASADGIWNEEGAFVRLVILPPWWRTWWAYAFYVLLFLAGVLAVDRIQRRRLIQKERQRAQITEARLQAEAAELQARALQAENERKALELEKARELEAVNAQLRLHEEQLEAQARRLMELDAVKSRFFANISHEFRTPLTLILGPLEDALADPDRCLDHRQMGLMRRSAHRLLRLIGQLLDLSRLEAGSMHLHLRRGDLAAFLRRLVLAFASRAEREGIALSFTAEPEAIILAFDADKLEKIVANLLSNAFRFTGRGGKIRVSVAVVEEEGRTWVEIVVRDTGQGIPREAQPRLFDRFFQVDDTRTRAREGTGIGLALVKELVELHGGAVELESQVGFGSAFFVRLPFSEEAGEETVWEEEEATGRAWLVEDEPDPAAAEPPQAEIHGDRPVILLVEDNPDVRAYLKSHLAGAYRIEEASEGREGLEKARALVPDLVISDVMMPELDGYALCRAIKTDEATNHIPVILLTAKADQQSKLEGLETGADEYLSKPFNAEELLLRVENLIEIRRLLRRRFSGEVVIKPGEIAVPSADAAFLERVRQVVEAHLGDPAFGVEWLAEEVGVSSRQLYRKLQALLRLSPAGYVRMMRLERAAQLLEQGAGTVSEVAYRVGFQDAEHFSKLFRQSFGVVPSAYPANQT